MFYIGLNAYVHTSINLTAVTLALWKVVCSDTTIWTELDKVPIIMQTIYFLTQYQYLPLTTLWLKKLIQFLIFKGNSLTLLYWFSPGLEIVQLIFYRPLHDIFILSFHHDLEQCLPPWTSILFLFITYTVTAKVESWLKAYGKIVHVPNCVGEWHSPLLSISLSHTHTKSNNSKGLQQQAMHNGKRHGNQEIIKMTQNYMLF